MRSLFLSLGILAVGVAAATSLAVTSRAAGAQREPVAEIKDVMNGNNHKSTGLYGLVKATLKAEPSAADWKLDAFRCAMIAEGGNTLMGLVPPKGCEDDAGKAKWAAHCADFRSAVKELLKACKLKKYEDAKAASVALEKQCESCHTDHQSE